MKERLAEKDLKAYVKECNDARRIIYLVRQEYLDRFIRYPEMKHRFRVIMGLPESAEIPRSMASRSLAISNWPSANLNHQTYSHDLEEPSRHFLEMRRSNNERVQMYRNEEDEWRRRDAAIHSKILEKERVAYDSQVKSNLFFNKVFKDFLEFEG